MTPAARSPSLDTSRNLTRRSAPNRASPCSSADRRRPRGARAPAHTARRLHEAASAPCSPLQSLSKVRCLATACCRHGMRRCGAAAFSPASSAPRQSSGTDIGRRKTDSTFVPGSSMSSFERIAAGPAREGLGGPGRSPPGRSGQTAARAERAIAAAAEPSPGGAGRRRPQTQSPPGETRANAAIRSRRTSGRASAGLQPAHPTRFFATGLATPRARRCNTTLSERKNLVKVLRCWGQFGLASSNASRRSSR